MGSLWPWIAPERGLQGPTGGLYPLVGVLVLESMERGLLEPPGAEAPNTPLLIGKKKGGLLGGMIQRETPIPSKRLDQLGFKRC